MTYTKIGYTITIVKSGSYSTNYIGNLKAVSGNVVYWDSSDEGSFIAPYGTVITFSALPYVSATGKYTYSGTWSSSSITVTENTTVTFTVNNRECSSCSSNTTCGSSSSCTGCSAYATCGQSSSGSCTSCNSSGCIRSTRLG